MATDGPGEPPGPPRGTVGVYDRPAGADRRVTLVKALVVAVSVAAAAASAWMFDWF
jgi:hypothetical protein